MPTIEELFYTVNQAAPLLGIDATNIRKKIADGKFQSGKRRYIRDKWGVKRLRLTLSKKEVHRLGRR